MDKKISTKEKILLAALELFAERGYDDTPIDMIAEKIGIKGPSIYAHYKGKEDILDKIISKMEQKYGEIWGNGANVGKIPESVGEFREQCIKRLDFTVKDPHIRTIRILCFKEQFRNEKLAMLATKHQIVDPQKLYTTVIGQMIDKGLLKNNNPKMLATELAAQITLLVAAIDREPNRYDELWKQIVEWLDYFIESYRV